MLISLYTSNIQPISAPICNEQKIFIYLLHMNYFLYFAIVFIALSKSI